MQKIVLASGNKKKLTELQSLLTNLPWDVVPQSAFNIPDAIEDGLSFIENAIIKARHAAKLSGLPAVADDSGIAVDALGGSPGIYSARFAGEHGDDAANNQKLLDALIDVPEEKRTAQFHCVLALVRHAEDPVPVVCHGVWQGSILRAPRGENGFGYDPLFWVPSHACSSAELSAIEKNRISHRGQAMQLLLNALRSFA
ncbi:MAG TPA: RdgB/HAM1 family non-canonical purine NTP pyrophosphatase [Pseudomonadales bacterium]|jgi:XTP/dITP diphosphohydrolase|nr:RdgB/HAM1 family non-canonical purine NTP pyrophosphatase [Pseudomonadales bacterium]HNN86341.1 RdgB/HAM1 family non-canonical purine NTP pyrophosphatase [Pseudomonadales bacterium]